MICIYKNHDGEIPTEFKVIHLSKSWPEVGDIIGVYDNGKYVGLRCVQKRYRHAQTPYYIVDRGWTNALDRYG